jgi:hypothetical protein
MRLPFVVWIALVLLTTVCLAGSFIFHRIISEVNRKLPSDKQISYFFMYPTKSAPVYDEYRKLYPSGNLLFWSKLLNIGPIIWFLFMALWLFGVIKQRCFNLGSFGRDGCCADDGDWALGRSSTWSWKMPGRNRPTSLVEMASQRGRGGHSPI